MEQAGTTGTIKELINEINILRKHISWSTNGVSYQLTREIMKVRMDVISALDRYHANDDDRKYLEKLFTQLRKLEEDLSRNTEKEQDQSRFKTFLDKLDRKCCNIQLFLSELEFPGITP